MALQLQIRGRVQGVGYRAAMVDKALELGVTGWVRNRRDGCVEAVVCGNEDALRAVVAWAHVGPSLASVSAVAVTGVEAAFDTFEWRPTE